MCTSTTVLVWHQYHMMQMITDRSQPAATEEVLHQQQDHSLPFVFSWMSYSHDFSCVSMAQMVKDMRRQPRHRRRNSRMTPAGLPRACCQTGQQPHPSPTLVICQWLCPRALCQVMPCSCPVSSTLPHLVYSCQCVFSNRCRGY